MLKEVARYGVFKKRDAPVQPNEGVVAVVDNSVNKSRVKPYKVKDVFNPFEVYDYDTDYEEVLVDECYILEQDSE